MSSIVLFQGTTLAQKAKPRDLTAFGLDNNIADNQTVPSLSIRGGKFRIVLDGQEKVVTRTSEDGDEVAVSQFDAVIVGAATRRGRAYFEGGFTEGENKRPVCWSYDGDVPSADVPADQKQCATCESCLMVAKGSKVTEGGKAVRACAQHRLIAIIPAQVSKESSHVAWDHTPLRLRLPITSVWDKELDQRAQAQGWRAFDSYLTEVLKPNSINHTAEVITRIKFDPTATQPKLIFRAVARLDDAEFDKAARLATSQEVLDRISGGGVSHIPATEAKPTVKKIEVDPFEEDEAPKPKAANKGNGKAKPVAKAPEVDPFEEEDVPAVKAAKPAAKAQIDPFGDDDTPAPAKPGAVAKTSGNADLDIMLGSWDD